MSSMDVWAKPPCERAGYSENSASRPPGDQNSFCPASASSTAALNKSAAVASSSTENAGSTPNSTACMRKMREHIPWIVEIHASSTLSAWAAMPSAASVAFTRDLISPAALKHFQQPIQRRAPGLVSFGRPMATRAASRHVLREALRSFPPWRRRAMHCGRRRVHGALRCV